MTISRTMASPRPLPPWTRVAGHAKIPLEHDKANTERECRNRYRLRKSRRIIADRFGGQRDLPALRRVRQGVVQQVLQGMLELIGIGRHRRQISGDIGRNSTP